MATPLPIDEIRRMIEIENMSMSKVAKLLNKKVSVIYNCCKRNNIISKHIATPSRQFTQSEIDDIITRYNNEVSVYKLSSEYNCAPPIINKLLKSNNVHIRNKDESERPLLLNDKIALAIELKDKSIRKIASELKVKISTVSNAVRRLGLDNLIYNQTITNDINLVRELYESGINLIELSEMYDTYPTTISNIIKRAGGSLRGFGVKRDSKYVQLNDKTWLENEYKDKSMRTIAIDLECSVGVISYMLDKHGIEKRDKATVYKHIRKFGVIKSVVDTKWGTFKLKSNIEREFVLSLSSDNNIVQYEPDTFEYAGSEYTPDFKIDGKYIEVKSGGNAIYPGINRQRFIKQLMVARRNNIDINLWCDGKYNTYHDIDDIDKYFCLNWKLMFDDYVECYNFLIQYGFHPLKWCNDELRIGLNKAHYVLAKDVLNANYRSQYVTNLIKHFNDHYWYSKHKDYLSFADCFSPGNELMLKNVIRELWNNPNGINIYGLYKYIIKYRQNFTTVSIFKPWIAQYLYNKLINNKGIVLDPCAGWGGRLLGTLGYDIKYIGYDINPLVKKSHHDLIKFAGSMIINTPIIETIDSSICDWPDADLLFTSPPYDDTEYYHGNTQRTDSSALYHNIMKFKGIIALNIPIRHANIVIDIANKHNKSIIDKYEMKVSSFMGRSKTYEPILVFR